MSRKTIIIIISAILVVIAGYISIRLIYEADYTRHINLPDDLKAGYNDGTVDQNATSTKTDIFGQTDPILLVPSTSYDTSSWNTYYGEETGYSIKYPKNVTASDDGNGGLILAFAKDKYFHWPLLDDVKITITASSSCPFVDSSFIDYASSTGKIHDNEYLRYEWSDAGAGNLYREVAYDITQDSVCYHIDLLSHGTNGASFYVSDPALVTKYDIQHVTDMKAMLQVFNAIVGSFDASTAPVQGEDQPG